MERRDVRYQAAVVRDDHVLLLKVFDRADGVEFWLLPGGGREPGEGNGQQLAVATVHLESLRPSAPARAVQLGRIFPILEGAPHAVLMGDFNFCSAWAGEQANLDPAYIDVWLALRPGDPGYTVDAAVNQMHRRRYPPVRFDRVLLRSTPSGWTPGTIELLGDRPISRDTPKVFPSDHFGLLARFAWPGTPVKQQQQVIR